MATTRRGQLLQGSPWFDPLGPNARPASGGSGSVAGQAEIGALLVDGVGGRIYVNRGSRADPEWRGVLPFITPQEFGARGDARHTDDAAMTNGSAVVTSAAAAFSADDVGKYASVRGANTAVGGETLVTTVASVQSATQATLSAAANATVSGKRLLIGTDDTTAIQAAMNAIVAARGGVLHFPVGGYMGSAQMQCSGPAAEDPLRFLTIQGDKGATIYAADINIPYPGSGVEGSLIATTHSHNVTIQDLIFRGTGTGFSGPRLCVVRITGEGLNSLVRNLTVEDFRDAIPVDYSGTKRCVIEACWVLSCDYGIVQSNVDGSCEIRGCHVISPTLANTNVGPIAVSGRDNRIHHNYIEPPSQSYAIEIGDTGQDAVVVGNTIKGAGTTTGLGIRVKPNTGGDCVIKGNKLTDVGVGIIVNGANHILEGNLIKGVGAGSTGMQLYVGANPATHVLIKGNLFRNLAVGIDGNSLVNDRVLVNDNLFGADVTTKLSGNGSWTNSQGADNLGLADF